MKSRVSWLVLILFLFFLVLTGRDHNTFKVDKFSPLYHPVYIGKMSVARAVHQATSLTDGRVLITGGCAEQGCEGMLNSAELYDPAERSFKVVNSMTVHRSAHSAIALPDGRVLVTGGWSNRGVTASAEIYDPETEQWEGVGKMTEARGAHISVLLPDGRVMITGGARDFTPLATAEIFDPRTGIFTSVGKMHMARNQHAAVVLTDGRVLLTGGHSQRRGPTTRSAELFDPVTNLFKLTGEMNVPRYKHSAVSLTEGRVLVVGGSDERDSRGRYRSTELYDPQTGEFSPGPDMHFPRFKIADAMTVFSSGAVLVTGDAKKPEIYDPRKNRFILLEGEIDGAMMFQTTSLLSNEDVLILGGYDGRIRPSADAWIVSPVKLNWKE
jgi:hypothetical protein